MGTRTLHTKLFKGDLHVPRTVAPSGHLGDLEDDIPLERDSEESDRPAPTPGNAVAVTGCNTTTYTDENGDVMRFEVTADTSAERVEGVPAKVVRKGLMLYVNGQFKYVVRAVAYKEEQGTIRTRGPATQCHSQTPRGRSAKVQYLSGTIPENNVKELWLLVSQVENVKWLGDIPLTNTGACAIWLNVYDLSRVANTLNDAILSKFQLGIFHCGVEVFDTEYCFGFRNPHSQMSGIDVCTPRQHPDHPYRESVHLGYANKTKRVIQKLVSELGEDWRSDTYHLTHRNCLTFADAFSKAIGANVEIPSWIRNACEVSTKSSALDFVVDSFWRLNKWTLKSPPTLESQHSNKWTIPIPSALSIPAPIASCITGVPDLESEITESPNMRAEYEDEFIER